MATRTLQQITKQLAKSDKAAIQNLKQQKNLLPQQLKGLEKGLRAQQEQAFGNILSGAKSRGLKFSGIPLDEQAQYTATNFLPALAEARFGVQQQRLGLQGAIADIIRQRGLSAQSILQTEKDRAFQAAEAEKNRQASLRAARASAASAPDFGSLFSAVLGGGGGGGAVTPNNKQLRKETIANAQQYAQRINTSISDDNMRAKILQNLLDAGRERGDLGTMARFNALAKIFNFDGNFDLRSGKFSGQRTVTPYSPAAQTTSNGVGGRNPLSAFIGMF